MYGLSFVTIATLPSSLPMMVPFCSASSPYRCCRKPVPGLSMHRNRIGMEHLLSAVALPLVPGECVINLGQRLNRYLANRRASVSIRDPHRNRALSCRWLFWSRP